MGEGGTGQTRALEGKKKIMGGILNQREKQQEHHDGSSERGKLLASRGQCSGGSSLKVTRVITKEA